MIQHNRLSGTYLRCTDYLYIRLKMEAASSVTISVKVDITWCSTSASPPVACSTVILIRPQQQHSILNSVAHQQIVWCSTSCELVFSSESDKKNILNTISWSVCCLFYLFGYETVVVSSIKKSIQGLVLYRTSRVAA